MVNSHFGRVLLAIRENDFRAESLGYRTVVYRTLANCIAALAATLAGALMALWLGYVGPKTVLGFEIMTDILLIVVIGGLGRMYGAVVGTVVFLVAQNYLQAGMAQRLAGARLAAAAREGRASGPLDALDGDPLHRLRLLLSLGPGRAARRPDAVRTRRRTPKCYPWLT